MKTGIFSARHCALSLAVAAAFPVLAQIDGTPSLKDVVVTASRFEDSAASLPYGVSVITAQEIRDSGASSVSEAIVKLLGVPGKLDFYGGNNFALDLRGFGNTASSNQVIVVDGRRISEGDSSTPILSSIAIDSVQSIQVLRGAGAVTYGEGATGGVILITTKAGKGAQRSNGASLSATAGSNGMRDLRSSAVIASGGITIDVSGEDSRSNNHRENYAATSNSLASTVQWSNDWLRLGFQSDRNRLQTGLPGSLTDVQFAVDPSQAGSKTDWATINSESSGVFAEAYWGSWQLGLDAGQRTKQVASVMTTASEYNVNGSSANIRARHDTKGSRFANVLGLGLDTSRWDSLQTKQGSPWSTPVGAVGKTDSSAWYLTDDISYLPTRTRVSLGLRVETMTKSETTSATRIEEKQNAWNLGLTQSVVSGVSVYGNWGQSYRLPNIDDVRSINSALNPQTSKDLTAGIRWEAADNKVDIRWYKNDLTNEIAFDDVAYVNVNLSPTRRQGFELETQHQILRNLSVRTNAALRKSELVDGANSGKQIPLTSQESFAAHLDWSPIGGHKLSTGINWVSSQYVDVANTCSIPSHSTLDARYAYSRGNMEFALGIKNLADSRYYNFAYGCAASGLPTWLYPESGRAVAASFQIKL